MKKLIAIVLSFIFLTFQTAKAEVAVGITGAVHMFDATGTETARQSGEKNSGSHKKIVGWVGASPRFSGGAQPWVPGGVVVLGHLLDPPACDRAAVGGGAFGGDAELGPGDPRLGCLRMASGSAPRVIASITGG